MIFNSATKAFESMYDHIMQNGIDYAGTKAIFNASFELSYPEDMIITTPERNFKQEYAEFEWEWYLSGNRDATEISEKAKIWKSMIVPGTNEVNSNYGYFWNKDNQLERAIQELKNNPNSRRAIIVHYDLEELDRYAADTPCNVVLNFGIVNGRLNLTVFARSIDLWFGFGNDQYTFAKLMQIVANELDIQIGNMHWFVTNLHVYERHYDKLKKTTDSTTEDYQCELEDCKDNDETVSGSPSMYKIGKTSEKKYPVSTLLNEKGYNPKALECLDYFIDVNRTTEETFKTTRKREFNTGDKYIDNVNLYHNIDRRYEGFIFLLEDYFMQEESLTWDLYKPKANPDWTIYDYLFLIYSHRIFGSGTSNQYNHGYNNTILLEFQKYDSYEHFFEFMNADKGNFVSCCVNQPPRYPLKNLVQTHFRPWADYVIENLKPNTSIGGIVDLMNVYNKDNNLHAFNFHYLLMAGDLANYVNLNTKLQGLFEIDEYSDCKLGPTSTSSMKILKPGYKYKDFLDLSSRYDMKPMDLEDLLCVWLKYIKNPIWDYYVKPHHTMKDFENGWDLGIEKHKSYYKHKFNFESK